MQLLGNPRATGMHADHHGFRTHLRTNLLKQAIEERLGVGNVVWSHVC